ncbi:MAG: UvrD-helicase domain-containing protein, partial [Bacteroidia bacterium]
MPQSYTPNKETDKKFLVYTSSAGSGKTYTLSRFFIKLLLKNNNPNYFRHIAALTFTNKAANEMKERIFSNLLLLSLDIYEDEKQAKDAQNLLNDYSKFLQLSKEEIQEKSAKIVNEILHNYSDLTVQTIDKFTHKIVRPFARDLDISPDFSIELGEDDIIKKSVELMLQKSSGDEYLSKILLDFAYYKVDEGKRFQSFEDDLFQLADVFKKEEAINFLKDYRENTLQFFFEKKDEIKIKLKNVKQQIIQSASDAVKLIKSANIDVNDFYQSKSGVGVFFEKIAQENMPESINSYVVKAHEENIWYSSSSKNSAEIDAISSKLGEYLAEILKNLPTYYNYAFLYARIFPTALLNEVEKIIEEVKDSQNSLTISDFNKLISNLIATSHLSVPFLYERIGERYNHYLLDEFQDTSVLQWNNMLPLVDDSLSKGNENLLVGDAKQAIYRFRNGDVEQFVSLPKLPHKPNENYDFFEKSLERNIQKESLKTNYRSYSTIIEFNNLLFSELIKRLNDYQKEIYKDVAQEKTDKHGGYVNVEFYEDEDFTEAGKNFTLSAIKNAQNSGFNPNEIAVLVRKRKDINAIAEFLIQNNVEVVSEESLKLTYSKDVKKIIESFKLLINPNDSLQAMHFLLLLNPTIESSQLFELLNKKHLENYIEEHYQINHQLLNLSVLNAIDRLAFLLQLE